MPAPSNKTIKKYAWLSVVLDGKQHTFNLPPLNLDIIPDMMTVKSVHFSTEESEFNSRIIRVYYGIINDVISEVKANYIISNDFEFKIADYDPSKNIISLIHVDNTAAYPIGEISICILFSKTC